MIARLLAITTLGILLVGCNQTEPAAPVRPVLSQRVSVDDAHLQSFVGTIEAREKADLGFQLLGRLLTRQVNTGDLVKAGDVVASIDATTLDLAVRAAVAAVGNRKAERDNAAATVARIDALRSTGTAPEATSDDAHAAFDTADAAVRQAEADLAKARDALTYAELHAGFDGVVTATGAEVGQTVAAGQSVVTIAKPDRREAVIDVPDWMAETQTVGSGFVVTLQIAPDQPITGQLREIAPQSDAMTRSRRLRITLEAPPSVFRLGSTVEVRTDRTAPPAITLPDSAILSRDGKAYVWVVATDESQAMVAREGRVHLRPVETSPADPGRVRIVSGLSAGERVVTAGVHRLEEDHRVMVPGEPT